MILQSRPIALRFILLSLFVVIFTLILRLLANLLLLELLYYSTTVPTAVDLVIRPWYFGLGSLGRGFESCLEFLVVYVPIIAVSHPTCCHQSHSTRMRVLAIGLRRAGKNDSTWIRLEKSTKSKSEKAAPNRGFISCDAVQSCKWLPTFRRKVSLLFSGLKFEVGIILTLKMGRYAHSEH